MSSIMLYKWAALASPILRRILWAIEAAATKTWGCMNAPGPTVTQYDNNHADMKVEPAIEHVYNPF